MGAGRNQGIELWGRGGGGVVCAGNYQSLSLGVDMK